MHEGTIQRQFKTQVLLVYWNFWSIEKKTICLLPFLPTTTGKVYLIKQSYCESSKIEAVFN